jgi:hypothetical protein
LAEKIKLEEVTNSGNADEVLNSHPWKGKTCFAALDSSQYTNTLVLNNLLVGRQSNGISQSTEHSVMSMATLPLLTTTTPATMQRRPRLLPL